MGQHLDRLAIGYFGISPQPASICKTCPGTNIFSNGPETTCTPQCFGGYIYPYSDGGRGCIKCLDELNMQMGSRECICKSGYQKMGGACFSTNDYNAVQGFLSVNDKDCLGDQCPQKCQAGTFWNGTQCAYCSEKGTYPSS